MEKASSFSNFIIDYNDTILSSLKKMDKVGKKLLIVFFDNKYKGLISIGDIQRAIIKKNDLNVPISEILREDYIIATSDASLTDVKKMMLSIRAEFMPVIDKEGSLINIYFWEELFESEQVLPLAQFDVPIVVMAGGFGTRLRPLTNVIPKPLIPIGEKTIIEEIFNRFSKHGSNNFYVSLNFKSELIEFYLNNQKCNYNLNYFKEGKPMGTAGSLTLLRNKISSTFFVSNCDILIDQDYSQILDYHRNNESEITIVVAIKHFSIPYGIVETGINGKLLDLKEKPDIAFKINSGMYILEPHLLEEIPDNEFFHITQLIEKVKARNGKIGVFPVPENSWLDIGDWPEYLHLLTSKGYIK